MKNFILLFLISLPFLSWGQNQSFTIQDRLNSVTITPSAIETKRIGAGFDTLKNNIIIGKRSLLHPDTKENNIAIGVNVLQKNGEGINQAQNQFGAFGNIGIGINSLKNNTVGYDNISLGMNAMFYNTLGYRNIAMGISAMVGNITGNENIALGYRSLLMENGNLYSSSKNIGIGGNSLETLDNGSYNIGIGNNALRGIGVSVIRTFSNNVALGDNAFNQVWNGSENVSIGSESMRYISNGSKNVAIGNKAFKGGANPYDWSGSQNVSIGYESLSSNRNGNGNIAIGYQAGFNETGSNKLYIENSNASTPLIGGDFSSNRVGINRSITDIASTSQTLQVQGDALVLGKTLISSTASTARASLDVVGTDAIIVPVGTTAQRPATPVVGMIRYNAETAKFEGYTASGWVDFH